MKSLLSLLALSLITSSTSLSAPLPTKKNIDLFESFQSIWPFNNQPSPQNEQRALLKATLLSECAQRGVASRERIEELIYKLANVAPIANTATSPLLQKEWLLSWTTEKEINFFLDWKISNQITQTIDTPLLVNNIPFVRGGSFGVKGTLSNNEADGQRTYFQFTTATLDLGKWGSFEFPPIGEGWFDTIYLDDDLRVDTNSRNDILICTPMPSTK